MSNVVVPPAPDPSSAIAATAGWVGRGLVLLGVGAGIWLAGAASASADTGAAVPPVTGLTAVVPEALAVVPQTVDAVVAPVTGSPVAEPVIELVRPMTEVATSAVAEIAAPVDAAVLAVGRPVRPLVDPLLDGVIAPMAEPVVGPLAETPVESVVEAVPHLATEITTAPVPTEVAGPRAAVQHPDDAPRPVATPAPSGTLPNAPAGAPSSPSSVPAPPIGGGHSPAGPDLGSADLPDHTFRAALTAAGTSSEGPAPAVSTAAFDPSFSPD